MDGDATTPDGQGIQPVALVLAPFQGHVVGAGPDHGAGHEQRQQIGDQVRIDAATPAQPHGQQQTQQHGRGDEQPIPAQREWPQLENQGARRDEHAQQGRVWGNQQGHGRGEWRNGQRGGTNQMVPSAACTFST